jgi:hypothetical protein
MKKLLFISITFFIIQVSGVFGKSEPGIVATITVNSGLTERFDTPLSISLDNITTLHESLLKLYEITENNPVPVPFQFSVGDQRYINWLLSGITEPGKTRVFILVKEDGFMGLKANRIDKNGEAFVLSSNNNKVIQYNAGIVYPPDGVDTVFRRSGFIHPLYAPNKAVLTSIQPLDHLHHYGIWNPWTKAILQDEEVDFWNLGKHQGRVRFGGLVSSNEGPVFAGLQILHEHVAWPDSHREIIAMNELQEIKVIMRSDNKFLVDINIRLSPVKEMKMAEYRYAGFALRATPEWTNETSDFYTSRGLNRDQADGERAEWCVVWGDTPEGEAGILMMGHPSNFNHPEPLRVWPSSGNRGRGDVFINFNPTRNTDWLLEPGSNYLLRYRMVVFEGDMTASEAVKIWNDFSNQPVITIEK